MSDLLAPFTLRCGLVLPNRLALAPLTNQQSHEDGTLDEAEYTWLVRRAAGGFGLVETCASHVSRDGKGFDGQLGCYDDALLPGMTRLAGGLSAAGSAGMVQLYHGGVRSPSRMTGVQPWSASSFTEDRPEFEVPRPATEDDIHRVIRDFADAARRSEKAGFAGVELHGAHGYLLSQFLSATFNPRADGWGGDLVGRARLIRSVTQAVRAAVRPGFAVGVRLSPEDFGFARGLDLDETIQIARWLADDGVDFVHISLWDVRRNTAKRPDVHPIPLFRAALPADVALVAAGGVWSADDARFVADQGADLVSVGRAAILDPDWPKHVIGEGREPVRGPLTPEQLMDVGISPGFVTYLRRFRGLVA